MNACSNRLRWLAGLAAAIAVSPAAAAPLHTMPVKCGDMVLGKMDIDEYGAVEFATGALGGVKIAGKFVPASGKTFHFLQAILVDDAPFNFTDNTPFNAPYVDTPPGGYVGQPFDLKPYYDEAGDTPAFPGYFDQPRTTLSDSRDANKTGADGKINVDFETWLVCVQKETFGTMAGKAQDDSYFVAPLLGFTWGFSITLTDNGNADKDELADYNTAANPFAFTATPSAAWKAGLMQVYGGAPAAQDTFDIHLVDCANCVPEPATLALAGYVLLALAWRGRRC